MPTDSLLQAKRIARARRVSVATVIADAVSDGLRIRAAAQRNEEVLSAYQKAFTGFSDEEMLVLDGIVFEPATKRR